MKKEKKEKTAPKSKKWNLLTKRWNGTSDGFQVEAETKDEWCQEKKVPWRDFENLTDFINGHQILDILISTQALLPNPSWQVLGTLKVWFGAYLRKI